MDSGLEFVKVWHRVFSQNLTYVIDGLQPDSAFKVEVIANAGICQVGRWLAVQTTDVEQLTAFSELVECHNRYHQIAGETLSLFQAGEIGRAREILHSEFAFSSDAVCEAINTLEHELVANNLAAPRFKAEDVARSHAFWNASFEVGIESVDRRHHAIATLIEELSASTVSEVSQQQAEVFIKMLTHLITDDIKAETPILERHLNSGGSYFAEHLEAHNQITKHLADLAEDVAKGATISVKEIGAYFSQWFINHLVEFDLELPNYLG